MSKTLNLETFNNILTEAGIDRKELLENELRMAYGVKVTKMEELVAALNEGRPHHKILEQVNNIDNNCDLIAEELKWIE